MNFLKIKNETETSAEIEIYGDIVNDEWKGWDWTDSNVYPSDIKHMLDDLSGKDLTVRINSGGGDVFAGFAIANMIERFKGKTHAIVDGLCASIATQIALACGTVEIPKNAYFMIHKPFAGACGTADDIRKTADLLDKLQESIESRYVARLRNPKDADAIHEMVNDETWLTGEEAADLFDIECTKPEAAAAAVGSYAERLKGRPADLKIIDPAAEAEKRRQQEEKEKARAEIEIALALVD